MKNKSGTFNSREEEILFGVMRDSILWMIPDDILNDNNLIKIFGNGYEETNRQAFINGFKGSWDAQVQIHGFDFEMFKYLTYLVRQKTLTRLGVLNSKNKICMPDYLFNYEEEPV